MSLLALATSTALLVWLRDLRLVFFVGLSLVLFVLYYDSTT